MKTTYLQTIWKQPILYAILEPFFFCLLIWSYPQWYQSFFLSRVGVDMKGNNLMWDSIDIKWANRGWVLQLSSILQNVTKLPEYVFNQTWVWPSIVNVCLDILWKLTNFSWTIYKTKFMHYRVVRSFFILTINLIFLKLFTGGKKKMFNFQFWGS